MKITANKDGSGDYVDIATPTVSGTDLTFTVPTTAKTGYLQVTVNNVKALNNINAYEDYNTETNSKAYDHNTLTDDRLVHIWRVTQEDTFKGSKNGNYPAMSSDTDGRLYASFTNYGQAKSYYSKAFIGTTGSTEPETSSTATGDVTTLFFGYDPPEDTDISVGADGKINVFYNANYHGGSNTAWNAGGATEAGGMFVYDPDAPKITYNDNSNGKQHPLYRFELYTYDNELNQFKNTRVNRTFVGGEAYVNVVYYDRLANVIKYSFTQTGNSYTSTGTTTTYNGGNLTIWTGQRYNRTQSTVYGWTNTTNYSGNFIKVGNNYYKIIRNTYYTSNNTNTASYYYTFEGYEGTGNIPSTIYTGSVISPNTSNYGLPWITIDGEGDNLDKTGTTEDTNETFTFTGDWIPFKLDTSCYHGISQTGATGESVALTANASGYPIVFYMDAATSQPRIAFADSRAPSASSNWTVQGVFSFGDANYDTASDYMSCMVDSSGYLHIAFQNTKGQLVYGKGTYNSASGVYDFGESQVLDDSGMWIDMTMNGDVPFISYLSRVNSYDGMKIAYYDSTFDYDNDGVAEGGWETLTAALDAKVTNIRTCVEPNAKANDGVAYTAAIGFSPGSDYRAAFYVGK